MSTLTIRQALPTDHFAVSTLICENGATVLKPYYSILQQEAFPSFYKPENILYKIENAYILCAFIDEVLVGTIGLKGAEVFGFYTKVGYLNKGIGNTLLQHIEAFAKAQGLNKITLVSSPYAVNYYLKKGWQSLEEADVYYDGVAFLETHMEKNLV